MSVIRCDEGAASYKVLTIIGSCFNGVGSVWLARHRVSGNLVALKKYDLDKCDNEVLCLLKHEVRSMRSLSHANLTPCLHAFVLDTELWLMQPLCGYGSTKDLLVAHFNQGLPERAVALLLRDVLRAVDYLHTRGVIHRSIRASHVLVSETGSACLSGLRSCLWLYSTGRRKSVAHSYPQCSHDSLHWLSPELLAQDLRGYDCLSDIYSIGVLACELANGLEPFAQMPPTAMLYEKLAGAGEPVLLDSLTVDPTSPLVGTSVPPSSTEDDSAGLPYHSASGSRCSSVVSADNCIGERGGVGMSELESTFRRVMRIAPHRRFADSLHQLVAVCVNRERVQRPTAAQLLAHPFIQRTCKRAPPLTHLLKPSVPVNECNLLEGEQIKSDSLMTGRDVFSGSLTANSWDF